MTQTFVGSKKRATDDIAYEVKRAASLAMPGYRRRYGISGIDHRIDNVLQPMLIEEIWKRIFASDPTISGVNHAMRVDKLLPRGIAKRLAAAFTLWYTTYIV